MLRYSAQIGLLCVVGLLATAPASAQLVQSPYDDHYVVVDLGTVPGLPSPNGGLTFLSGDPDTLIIGGGANEAFGMLYRVQLVRDVDGHVTGFSGSATLFAEAPFNDGGVSYGPSEVLFLSRFPTNELGQIPAGGTSIARITDLAAMGVAESPGGLSFVPTGFPGEGSLKLASWSDGGFYTLQLGPMESGTFGVISVSRDAEIAGGPEGFVYVPQGSPRFADNEMLVSDWTDNTISVYSVDNAGNPVPSSRRPFVIEVTGPEGAAIDPLTGDFFFSTFAPGNDKVLVIRGFAVPPPDLPDDPPGAECGRAARRGPGYWHRQCLGAGPSRRGLDPGRGKSDNRGHGPRQPTDPTFVDQLAPCAEAMLDHLGLSGVSTCEGMDPDPVNDSCEHAIRRLTTLALNVCSDRLSESCEVSVAHRGCTSTSIGGLMAEASALIQLGNCQRASACLQAVNGKP